MNDVQEDQFKTLRECSDCRFSSFDMDGPYCAHKSAGVFGGGFFATRSEGKPCGPEGKLFKKSWRHA